MGFDLEKRVANELNRLEDEVAHSPDIKPAKRLEHFRRIAAELKQRMLGGDVAPEAPGKRTQIDELFTSSIAKMTSTAARAQQQLGNLPWQVNAGFDDYRARGLREVIQALGTERARLQRATVGSAAPAIAARVQSGQQPKGNEAGQAMWQVAERRAATLYRHAMDGGEVASEDPVVDEALARCGSGQALASPIRKRMEAELGISLSRVRIHTDRVAAAATKAVRAEAFTVGEDIFFSEGAFSPDSREGQKLLAHELAHVVQAYQGRTSTGGKGISVSQPGESLEREADAVADRIEARASRPAPRTEPARIRFGSNAAKYKAVATPVSVMQPAASSIAAAPVIAQPVAKQAATLMRKGETAPGDEVRGGLPRDQRTVDPDNRGKQPRFEHVRDHAREQALRETKKGTKVDPDAVVQEGKNVLKRAVTGMKQDVKAVQNLPVGKKADDQGKTEDTKHRQLATQAKAAVSKATSTKLDDAPKTEEVAKAKADGGGGSGGQVMFKKVGDWTKYMPEDLPDTDAGEKKKIADLIKKKINHDRQTSSEMLNKLANAQKAEARSVRAMAPGLVSQVKGAMSSALGKVSEAEGQQVAAVQGAIAAESAKVRDHAASMIGAINGAFTATMTGIRNADRDAKQALTQAKTKSLTDINTAQAAQIVSIGLEYLAATGRMQQIGAAKASEASALPSQVALPYSGDKLEAAEKAAREVAGKYAEAMPAEAAKAAAQLSSTKAEVEGQVREMATLQIKAVEDAFKQAKSAIEEATRQATEAATALKTNAISQVNSTMTTTTGQLAAHGTQQVMALRSAASSARSGISQAGNGAASAMGQSVEAAAKGVESGVKGLIQGAKEIEAPDPLQTHKQVAEASKQLQQGTKQISTSFNQSVTSTSTALGGQATSAAQGLATTANAAKASATTMADGACTALTKISSGAKEGLTGVGEGHGTSVTQLSDRAKDQLQQISDQLKEAYGTMCTTLKGKLNESCENARGQFSQAVPTDERTAILENAKKAADAVKPWWQKALAFVVQIIVAVAITIAVGVLIGATGGLALVAVGLLAGALSTVGGQMASNLVMGESLMNGITVRSVLAGAIGGAVTAGFGAGLASGLTSFGGATGSRIATTIATKGMGGLGGAAIRTGAGVAGDMVGDVATQLVAEGSYNFSMQTLVQSVVMNGVTQTKRYGDIESGLQQSGRSIVPSIDISTGSGNTPMGPRPAGDSGGSYLNVQTNARGQQGKLATHTAPTPDTTPAPSTQGGPAPSHTPTADATPAATPAAAHADPAAAAPAARTGGAPDPAGAAPAPTAARTNAAEPTAAHANPDAGGQPAATAPGGATRRTGGTPDADGGAHAPGDRDGATARTNDNNATTDRDGAGSRANDPAATTDGATPKRADAKGADADGDGGKNRSAKDNNDGSKGDSGGDDGADAAAPAAADHKAAAHDDGDAGGGSQAADSAGPESGSASELADLGYPNATRAKGDQAADTVEGGGRPKQDAVRETEANAQGLKELAAVDADPALTPEARQNIRKDVAEQLRADEPTGNLPRDIAEAKAREAKRTESADPSKQGADPTKQPTDGKPAADGKAGGAMDPTNAKEVLQMHYAEFNVDPIAQKTLFEAASAASARMSAVGADMTNGLPGADSVSTLKRDNHPEFVTEVVKKQELNSYESMGKMTDIIRGRINVDTGADMQIAVERLLATFPKELRSQVKEPRPGYPRWHINVIDAPTGLVHEWQVGTKSTTDFFEREALVIPGTVTTYKGKPNFHDGVYKLLDLVADPVIRQEHGLQEIADSYKKLAVETGTGEPTNYKERFDAMATRVNAALSSIEAKQPGYLDRVLANPSGKADKPKGGH